MVDKNKFNIRDITSISTMVAVISVLSQISIPMPHGVPLTMQFFAVVLSGIMLKPIHSIFSITIYITLGLLGVPVFSGFSSGINKLVGPTGGFIFAFYLIIIFASIMKSKKKLTTIILILISTTLFHFIGIIHYSFVMNTPFLKSLFIVSVPYFIKDIISFFTALFVGIKIKAHIKKYHS